MFSFKELTDKKNRPLVMGIVNITPDSFSDGGESFSPEAALKAALKLKSEGADIIDVGACSTAPMNETASEEEELSRLVKTLPLIAENVEIPLSVDTFRASAAHFALENGVSIINDESGFYLKSMAELVKRYGAGWVFMHTGGTSSKETVEYINGVTADVYGFFSDMRAKAISDGIEESVLCYDYGIGFGKTRADDLELLKNTSAFSEFSPLLVGVSRKRVIGEATGVKEPRERVYGSIAAAVMCALSGASIIRVHDVKATVEALDTAFAIKRGKF